MNPDMPLSRKITNFVPIMLIKGYRRLLSPVLPPACRFYPSCSAYGLAAYESHNLFRASMLTAWRIMRCNPFNSGGFDPCPGTEDRFSEQDRDDPQHHIDGYGT